jgi:hypothetical protein
MSDCENNQMVQTDIWPEKAFILELRRNKTYQDIPEDFSYQYRSENLK